MAINDLRLQAPNWPRLILKYALGRGSIDYFSGKTGRGKKLSPYS